VILNDDDDGDDDDDDDDDDISRPMQSNVMTTSTDSGFLL